jgi:hypothetical protein
MAQHGEDAIVINMNSNSAFGGGGDANTATNSTMSSTTRKTKEPLFGPNIGFVSTGPSWAVTNEKKVVTDDLTPDVVKGWMEKSKQVRLIHASPCSDGSLISKRSSIVLFAYHYFTSIS